MKKSLSYDQLLTSFLVLAVIFIILLLFLWKVPEARLTSTEIAIDLEKSIELENAIRTTYAQIIGGALILFGLFLTGLTVWSRWKTLEIMEEGQITERFTRAIDQLGSDKLQIRLGGIYALERIARDSEKDHWPIMEVLSAYVREKARGSSKDRSTKSEIPKEFKSAVRSPDDFLNELAQRPKPKADIQAILTVIGRCKPLFSGEDLRIDLIRTNLGGIDLKRADLRNTALWDCNLEHANLNYVNLESSNLFGTNLEEASLNYGSLKKGVFSHAVLNKAKVTQANLESANLVSATLKGTDLWKANLENAQINNANFERASLTGANLRNATAPGAIFQKPP